MPSGACCGVWWLDLDSPAQAVAMAAQAWAFRRADGLTPVAGATANQRLAILSSFYTFGARRMLLLDANNAALPNPISQVERAKVQAYAGARALPAERIADALAAIDRSTLVGLRDYAFLAVALETGRRSTELRMLVRGDVLFETDHRSKRITIIWRRVKGGKLMQDILAEGTTAALLQWLEVFYGEPIGTVAHDAPIFVSLSRDPSEHGYALSRQALANICHARLGTSKIHTTRHSFARHMEDAGAKVSTIQARLGHANLATTGRYLAVLASGDNPYASDLEARFGIAPLVSAKSVSIGTSTHSSRQGRSNA